MKVDKDKALALLRKDKLLKAIDLYNRGWRYRESTRINGDMYTLSVEWLLNYRQWLARNIKRRLS
jgi:hypothetical protein